MNLVLKTMLSLFIIVNPIGMAPVFLSLTPGRTSRERDSLALRAAIAVVLLLSGAAVMGQAVLHLFGIGLASFRVGGGILLLLIAIDMLHARQSRSRQTPEESKEAEDLPDIAVVPLALPLLAGPGAISTVILYAHEEGSRTGMATLFASILGIGLACWVLLRLATPLGFWLGQTGTNILTRLMGLILAATSIEFIAAGIRTLLPALALTR